MGEERKSGKLRMAGRVAWRVMLPFAAVRRTGSLAKTVVERRRESLNALKDLREEARKSFTKEVTINETRRADSFEDAMRQRSTNALSRGELYTVFLRQKRVALGAAAFFAAWSVFGILGGIWYGEGRNVVLGVMSLLASQPVFFMVALGAQLRLWQLRTGRLSKEEKGGLPDFMRETPDWWWVTLDPEFGHKEKG